MGELMVDRLQRVAKMWNEAIVGPLRSIIVLNIGQPCKSAYYLNCIVEYLGANLVPRVISLNIVA